MTLSERMKTFEAVNKTRLMIRTPVIVRVDGRAFHTYTRKFNKPKDDRIDKAMDYTMLYLCRNIPGCIFGYCQSDEISLVITDYKTLDTSPWYDYEVEKLVSVIASMATLAFNNAIRDIMNDTDYCTATFDARVFNLPAHEVENYLIWRQQDCIRNAIQGYAQAYYSQKELHGKSCSVMTEMLEERGIIWVNMDSKIRNGRLAMKIVSENSLETPWAILDTTPYFLDNKELISERVTNPV